MVSKGQKPPNAWRYFFVSTNNQETSLSQAVEHLLKSGRLQLVLIISQQAVSQKDQLKLVPRGIEQEIVILPHDSPLQRFGNCIALSFRARPKIKGSQCLRYLFQAAWRINAGPGFVQIHGIHIGSPYFKFGQGLKTLACGVPQDLESIYLLSTATTRRPDLHRVTILLDYRGQHLIFNGLPKAPVTKKPTDGNRHKAFKILLRIFVLIQGGEVRLHGSATHLLHMAGYSFFDSSSDLSVTVPGEAEPTKKLTKLLIIHNMKPPALRKRRE